MFLTPAKKDPPVKMSTWIKALHPHWVRFLLPILLLAAATFLIATTDADLLLSGLFYITAEGWYLAQSNPWYFSYHYGMIPAFALAMGGLAIFVLSFFYKKFLHYRKIALFIVVFLLVGPGLLINTIFKDHWGRARPADIVNFGGESLYQPCWQPGKAGQGKSFPSGHASVGFYLFAPYFFLRRKHHRPASAFLALGIAYGSFMGLGRIVQGGHFISDVVWSGGITYLSGLALSYIFRLEQDDY